MKNFVLPWADASPLGPSRQRWRRIAKQVRFNTINTVLNKCCRAEVRSVILRRFEVLLVVGRLSLFLIAISFGNIYSLGNIFLTFFSKYGNVDKFSNETGWISMAAP